MSTLERALCVLACSVVDDVVLSAPECISDEQLASLGAVSICVDEPPAGALRTADLRARILDQPEAFEKRNVVRTQIEQAYYSSYAGDADAAFR